MLGSCLRTVSHDTLVQVGVSLIPHLHVQPLLTSADVHHPLLVEERMCLPRLATKFVELRL